MPEKCDANINTKEKHRTNGKTLIHARTSRKAFSFLIAFLLSVTIIIAFCVPFSKALAKEQIAGISNEISSTASMTAPSDMHDEQLVTICDTPLEMSPIAGNQTIAYAILGCCGACVVLAITNTILSNVAKRFIRKINNNIVGLGEPKHIRLWR